MFPGPLNLTLQFYLTFFARQFENEDNANVHEQTTGIEIYNDF